MVQEEYDYLSGWTASDDDKRDYLGIPLNDLREPIYVSPAEEELYVRNKVKDATFIDFTDPDGETSGRTWSKRILDGNGLLIMWIMTNLDS